MKRLPTIITALFGVVLALPATAAESDSEENKATETVRSVMSWVERFSSGESKSTTYLGVTIEPVPQVLRDYIDLPDGVGLLFPKIASNSPADKAGLQDNDILVQFEDQLIVNYQQLSTLIDMQSPGDKVKLLILRKGEKIEVEVTLGERGNPDMGRRLKRSPPGVPTPPDAPSVPSAEELVELAEKYRQHLPESTREEVRRAMQSVEEWIPGSVRVLIDEEDQIHVDLTELKENFHELNEKLEKINLERNGIEELVREYGEHGARKSVVMLGDKTVNFSNAEGKVRLENQGESTWVEVKDHEGDLLYSGHLPENGLEGIPEAARPLLESLFESRKQLDLDFNNKDVEIELHSEEVDPVTFNRS